MLIQKEVKNCLWTESKRHLGDDVILAYGDWSRKCPMKHFTPTIGRGLRKILSKRFETVL